MCEPRRPGLVGPPGFHTTAREPKRGPQPSKHHQNSTKGPPRERRKNENCGGEEKKREILGGPERGPGEHTNFGPDTHSRHTQGGVRRNRSCGGAVTKRVVRRRRGPAESGENAQNTAHDTRHTTHNSTTKQHNTTTTTTTTRHNTKPHTDVVFFVPSSVFYFVPVFHCTVLSFFLSRQQVACFVPLPPNQSIHGTSIQFVCPSACWASNPCVSSAAHCRHEPELFMIRSSLCHCTDPAQLDQSRSRIHFFLEEREKWHVKIVQNHERSHYACPHSLTTSWADGQLPAPVTGRLKSPTRTKRKPLLHCMRGCSATCDVHEDLWGL